MITRPQPRATMPGRTACVTSNTDVRLTAIRLSHTARFNLPNGAVSTAEINDALQKALERRRERILADLDTNKDGSISKAELDASVDRLIAAADADHDGGVTLQEAQGYRLAKLRKPAANGVQAN